MNLDWALLFPLGLAAFSGLLVFSNYQQYHLQHAIDEETPERNFRVQQARRRIWGSSLLLFMSACMVVGVLIPARTWPSVFVAWWVIIVLLVGVLVIFALVDAWHTQRHFTQVKIDHRIAEAKLQADLRRLRGGE